MRARGCHEVELELGMRLDVIGDCHGREAVVSCGRAAVTGCGWVAVNGRGRAAIRCCVRADGRCCAQAQGRVSLGGERGVGAERAAG